ncbi:MAG: HYR domain-containing protein, partial [Verrucomicrobia bacterium]
MTVVDTTPPTINCVGNKTVECTTPWSFDAPTASDTCGTNSIAIVSTTTNATCGNTFIATRTWRATDACGNTAQCSQTVTVVDTTAPVINCVGNKTIQCGTAWTFDAPTASDTCGTNAIAVISTTTNATCGNTFSATRTWRATDACGNSAQCSQTVTVVDTTAPVITCPTNLTIECPASPTTNVTGVATATDVCGSVAITFSDSNATTCGNAKVVSRTWRATDLCGNSSTCVQTITVRDLTPPVLTGPTNLTIECGASIAPSATGNATATDTCNAVTVSFSDSVSNICGSARIITRRWLALDSCNNSNVAFQTITVRDTTAPVLTLPANRVLDCPGNTTTNNTGVATATDGCGSVTITSSDVTTNGCGMTRTVFRTWTATDQCGNVASGLQTIQVRNVAPTITCRALTFQCPGDVPPAYTNLAAFLAAGNAAASSCDASLDFALRSDSGLIGRCPGTETRVYRVTDDCGAFTECTQTITVDDTIAPVLTCPPALTVECGASLAPASIGSATATDNCSAVVITNSDAVVDGQYNLGFYVADPDSGTGPYSPTYLKFGPGSLPCPDAARLTGRALDPLRNAVAFSASGQLDALTSVGNVPMAFGQVVPFEMVIEASGGPGAERGTIEFTADWNTYTTSNDRFGYDTNYMVYCAFVDAADPGLLDPNNNARV